MTVDSKSKLALLGSSHGMTVNELLEEATYESIAKGICLQPNCDYDTDVEPDCRDGHCEVCNTDTVASCLVLAGVI